MAAQVHSAREDDMNTFAPRAHDSAYTLGLALVVLAGCCYASIGIGGKYAVEGGANVVTILLVRYGVASTLLWLILPMTGRQMRLPRNQALGFFLAGMGPHIATGFAFTAALQYISAGATTLLLYIYPAIVVGVQALSGREPFTRVRLFAVLAALLGCALVVG